MKAGNQGGREKKNSNRFTSGIHVVLNICWKFEVWVHEALGELKQYWTVELCTISAQRLAGSSQGNLYFCVKSVPCLPRNHKPL